MLHVLFTINGTKDKTLVSNKLWDKIVLCDLCLDYYLDIDKVNWYEIP